MGYSKACRYTGLYFKETKMSKLWRITGYRPLSGRIAKSKGINREMLPGDAPSPLLVALLNRVSKGE